MFSFFNSAFSPDTTNAPTIAPPPAGTPTDSLFNRLLNHYGGKSFNNGMYRIISPNSVAHWNELVTSAFPFYSGRISCFGLDWLGRVFAIDSTRQEDGHPGVLMLEPGTAQALKIPCNIESFHESELIQYQEEALAASFYHQWIASGGTPPDVNQCIGYKLPLFLGGSDTLENLEISDLDVYWTISAHLIQRTQGLEPGASIGKVTIS